MNQRSNVSTYQVLQKFGTKMALLSLCLLLTSNVSALELDGSVELSAEWTDNTTLVRRNEISDTSVIPGINFGFKHDTATLRLDGAYHFERRFYSEDIFDDENFLTGSTTLLWEAIADRLDIRFQDRRTQATVDSTGAPTEDNRQEVQTTEIGPILKLGVRNSDEIQAEYRFTNTEGDESTTDKKENMYALRYILGLSNTRNITIEAITQKIKYDDGVAPDVNTEIGQVTYEHISTNYGFSLTGGYSKYKRNRNRRDVSGGIGELQYRYTFATGTELELNGTRQIREAEPDIVGGGSSARGVIRADSTLNETFIDKSYGIGASHEFGATTVSARLYGNEEDYIDIPRDNKLTGASLTISREVNSRLSTSLQISRGDREYDQISDEIEETIVDLGFLYQAARKTRWGLYLYYEKDSGTLNYDALTATISFEYALGQGFTRDPFRRN